MKIFFSIVFILVVLFFCIPVHSVLARDLKDLETGTKQDDSKIDQIYTYPLSGHYDIEGDCYTQFWVVMVVYKNDGFWEYFNPVLI